MVSDEILVRIPVGADLQRRRVLRAAVDLHEADTALDETPREEALPAEGAEVGVVDPVAGQRQRRLP